MKILLLAYAVSPFRGSEYSVAWNHIIHLSKKHEITVLYGTSGDHIGEDNDMVIFHKNKSIRNVHWHHVKPSSKTKLLNSLNERGFLTYSFYLAYRSWHKDVLNYCNLNIDFDNFDLIHFQSPIGYREPGYLWKVDLPYVWGPVGGANSVDYRLLNLLGISGSTKQLIRKCLNWFQLRYSYRLKKALNNTTLLLTATTENQELFSDIHGVNSLYIPENGPIGDYLGKNKSHNNNDVINLIWVGRIDAAKGLRLLIDSFAHIKDKYRFKVNVVGDGPLRQTLTNYVEEKGLCDVFTWHGKIPRVAVLNQMQMADLHVITSVSEANTTVIWEAIQNGVPSMSLKHCGMRDIITADSGITIDLDNYNVLVENFGHSLDGLSKNPALLSELKVGIESSFHRYHWDSREKFFDDAYIEAIKVWKKNTNL